MRQKKAVILFSGGLDSTTCLAIAHSKGYECYALSFRYGQRHSSELEAAKRIAKRYLLCHKIIDLDLGSFGGSALTDTAIDLPVHRTVGGEVKDIPVTYVPARNTIFLSIALAWAEVLKAEVIFTGVNAVDYSGYPDCRPEYIDAFQKMADLATKAGVNGIGVKLEAPLIHLTKVDIIHRGQSLGVDYAQTVSCYQADSDGRACGRCESCRIRQKAFNDALGLDPTVYYSDNLSSLKPNSG